MGIDRESGYSKAGRAAAKSHLAQVREQRTVDVATDAELALEELQATLENSQGYLRVGWRAGSGFWARWKWTDGALAGRYVFARCDTLCSALQEVCGSASEVREGRRTATLDKRP